MKAILRVSKIKGAGSMTGKSLHNYRLGEVPNADPQRAHLNREYVNPHRELAPAIEARLQQAGLKRIRQDAVKGMEFILTASPELFKRDEAGQVLNDYRKSKWVGENLKFMQEKYGKNLVAFTLHQDEKTPHIHAVVVPITTDGRLCAKELFNPQSLRRLQTDYATAMQPFGLERGIEGSRARHVEMKHIYGIQQKQRQELDRELKPIETPTQPLKVDKPGALDLLQLERWKADQEAKINAEYTRRLEEVKKAARKAQNIAVANATAKSEGKVLQQKLATSESLKQSNHTKLRETSERLGRIANTLEAVVMLSYRQEMDSEWLEKTAKSVEARITPDMHKAVAEVLKEPTHSANEVIDRLERKGYQFTDEQADGRPRYLEDSKSFVRLDLKEVRFEGKTIHDAIKESIERTQKQDQQQQEKRSRGMRM
jgi:hypothetical protein